MSQGTLFIISAPSGAGKTSLVAELLSRNTNIEASISHTTRPRRPSEKNGVNYHFINKSNFLQMIDEQIFLEHALVFSHFYGTSKTWVIETLAQGINVILEIDWQGAKQARAKFPKSKSIFILPPSIQALKDRLNARGQDDPDVIVKRISMAREEMTHYSDADYVIVNDDFNVALEQLESIIYKQCPSNVKSLDAALINELLS
jgi:guanylate kinase